MPNYMHRRVSACEIDNSSETMDGSDRQRKFPLNSDDHFHTIYSLSHLMYVTSHDAHKNL